ncbi:DUF485 domain-containing protein [Actinomadura sp. 7K507]|uniref:DUF485 domain-containing protein n=1 Tax=Actinomadura sp. 7K507 TaxID=2530365 RepID=UPI001A9CC06A|nr:DUF485 domain-containing protein [Actinomadura sp. 7K507]
MTGPRTRAVRRPTYPVTREIDEQTGLGEAYMRSLLRTQLRLAVGLCLVLAVVVAGLPLLFALVPAVREQEVLGLPLPWVLLGAVIYPWFVACGWWYVRHAERNEDDFAELVERSSTSGDAPTGAEPTAEGPTADGAAGDASGGSA